MTSDVVGVGSVGQVPDCAVGVLCWPMRGKIFYWKHSFFSAWLGQFFFAVQLFYFVFGKTIYSTMLLEKNEYASFFQQNQKQLELVYMLVLVRCDKLG